MTFLKDLSIRIPESLHKRVKVLASKDNISINQFIATALAEKLSALDTEDYLKERANRGSREKYLKVLAKVKDRDPLKYDQ
jgi:predicted transcriptional regulator